MNRLLRTLALGLGIFSCVGCQSMTYGMRPPSSGNALSSNQASREFETGTTEEKDSSGMWVIAVIAGVAAVGSAILIPLMISDKL